MKKLFIILSISCLAISCGNNNETKKSSEDDKVALETPVQSADYTNGLALVANSDCLTCHKINEQLIGPAYAEVAARYPATDEVIDSLAHTIIKGSVGKWGNVPMNAHPQLSLEDAKSMVKYIMTLKK